MTGEPVDESAARIERVPQAIYRVMLTDHDGWSYTVNEAVSFDQFVSERAATVAAKKDAQEASLKGYNAIVMVKRRSGDWQTVAEYGPPHPLPTG